MKFIILIFFFIYLTAGFVSGQWSERLGSDNSPVCVMPDTQYNAQVVSDGNEGAYIAWEDKRSGRWRIYIQYVDASGNPIWTTNGIPVCSDTIYQRYFDLQEDGSGGVFLAWEDRRFNRNSIFAQRINSSGTLLWGSGGLNVFDSLNSYYPKILSNNGNVIISWHSSYSGGGFATEMHVQKINSAGIKLWGNNGKRLTNQTQDQWYGRIVSGENGGAIISWEDNGFSIKAQKVDSLGNILWASNGVLVSTSLSSLYRHLHKSVPNGNGGAIIAWEQEMAQFGPFHIYAQNMSSTGSKLWPSQGLSIASEGHINYEIAMIRDNNNGAIISWHYVDTFTTARIQRINSSGNKLWGGSQGLDICQVSNVFSHVFNGLVPDGKGGVMVASFDTRNDINDIYSYRFNSSGLRDWDSLGVMICNRDSSQLFPGIAKTNSGVMIAWEDARNGHGDIYCQKVTDEGILTGIPDVSNIMPKKYILSQNYPNPFNPATKIRFDIPFKAGTVKLAVYNSLGQVVASLVDEVLSPGSYEYTFDGSDLASGMYFYRLQAGDFIETKKMALLK